MTRARRNMWRMKCATSWPNGCAFICGGQGLRHDVVGATFAVAGADDLVQLHRRSVALADFVATADGANLLSAYRRATNIVRIEEKKDGVRYDGPVEPCFLRESAEIALHGGLARAGEDIGKALREERFDNAMRALAALRAPLDRFFDDVTVNADDAALRANRLRLLSRIRTALSGIADFSLIESAPPRGRT